jgi:cation diffusion facilitator CzcD-associated flavoprotein CzcO
VTARYCVIGAGAAGLAALQTLREAGLDADCFERTDRAGGHWHTDYEALHLITSRTVSGFPGDPMPADYPLFPSRDQVRDYLVGFAERQGLLPHITFGTEVLSVEPAGSRDGSGGWRVTTSAGDAGIYDGVLVANGHLWDPVVPKVTGEFTGTSLHSSQYRNTGDIQGDRVLVVGVGNSGCDLAVDAAQARLDTAISVRTGAIFQPKTIYGRPRSEIRWFTRLPPRAQDRVARALIRVVHGPWSAYPGLPKPRARTLADGRPVVNSQLLYWIQHGRIKVVPGIERCDGRTVHFSDGSSREVDTILWATGFHVNLSFLDPELLQWRDGVPLKVGGHTVPLGLEKLYFVGLVGPRGPQFPVYTAQSQLITKFIAAHDRAPGGSADLSSALAALDPPDSRIDIVRPVWQAQMARAERVHKAR